MKTIWNNIDGYKTYLGVSIVFLAGGLLALGVIDQEQFNSILAIGGAMLGFGLRQAIGKLKNK